MSRLVAVLVVLLWLGGCVAGGGSRPVPVEGGSSGEMAEGQRYALAGDAYPEDPPDVSQVPDAMPQREPRSRGGNRSPYEVWGKTYRVLADASGYRREGRASWYGEKFHGYATSNGEIYDMYKMSAAHRSLPLPSFARVTSLESGHSVIVRVNDRGPFHSEREIDLSYAAAARLGILEQGTGRVRVEAIDVERWLTENGDRARSTDADVSATPLPEGAVFLQVAALRSAEGAGLLRDRLQARLAYPVRVASQSSLHRVQVGPLAHADQVESLRDALRQAGFAQTFLIRGAVDNSRSHP